MTYKYFRYIFLPKLGWYVTGMFIWDPIHSFYHLNIAKRKPLWPDADPEKCPRLFCRYCGRGTIE